MAKRLDKQLGLVHVFAISTGAMISSGLFVLPGIAASKMGPTVVLAYLLSGVLLLPSLFSMAELSTAMPRAGGTYFFISRGLGGMFGTIDGVGVWLALVLKGSIALIGLGAYLTLYLGLPVKATAVLFCVVFMVLNLVGAKETAGLQVGMVFVMLAILVLFVIKGVVAMGVTGDAAAVGLTPGTVEPAGLKALLPTTAFVFISYIGLTKVASVAEEVRNPERNIPLGMCISLLVVMVVYGLVVWVLVRVLPAGELYASLTPVSDCARRTMGRGGAHLVSVAAVLAFATTANAAIMSASRYLLAMSRDRVVPHGLSHFSRFRTPMYAIYLTSGVILLVVLSTGLERIAKLASTFQLLVFAMVNVAVIVMRESGIKSYDPGFRSPFYPYAQVVGVMVAVVLIPEMGLLSSIFAMGVVGLGVVWHNLYGRRQVVRIGAVAQMAQRVAEKLLAQDANAMGLNRELREILKEKGLRRGDPFAQMVHDAEFVEVGVRQDSEDVIRAGAHLLAQRGEVSEDLVLGALLQRNRLGETPAEAGVALPHLLLDEVEGFHLVAARSVRGVDFPMSNQAIHAIFVLLGNRGDPTQHLRFRAEIARRAENPTFIDQWIAAESPDELRDLLLEEPGEPIPAVIGDVQE